MILLGTDYEAPANGSRKPMSREPSRVAVYFSTDVVRRLKRRIRGYELAYRMKSADALRGVRSGEIKETHSIARWLQAVMVVNRVEGKTHIDGIALKTINTYTKQS